MQALPLTLLVVQDHQKAANERERDLNEREKDHSVSLQQLQQLEHLQQAASEEHASQLDSAHERIQSLTRENEEQGQVRSQCCMGCSLTVAAASSFVDSAECCCPTDNTKASTGFQFLSRAPVEAERIHSTNGS